MRISEFSISTWNPFVNLKPQNKIVTIFLLALGLGTVVATAVYLRDRNIKKQIEINFIDIFSKLENLPKIQDKYIHYGDYPFVKFAKMSQPIMQTVDKENRKVYALRIHATIPAKELKNVEKAEAKLLNPKDEDFFERDEVLIVYQPHPDDSTYWALDGCPNFERLLEAFPCSNRPILSEKYNRLKQLIVTKRLEWEGIVYEVK